MGSQQIHCIEYKESGIHDYCRDRNLCRPCRVYSILLYKRKVRLHVNTSSKVIDRTSGGKSINSTHHSLTAGDDGAMPV